MVKERAEDLEEQDLTQLRVLFDLISQLTKRESPQKEESEEEDDPYLGIKQHCNHDYSLIKRQTKNQMDLDLYSLFSPVLFWCDYTVEKESRIHIFKPAWKSLVHLLEALPVDTNKKLIPIIFPYLERIYDFSQKSSPTLSMLKFINLILEPINKNCVAYELSDSKAHRKLTSFLLMFSHIVSFYGQK